MAHEFDIERLHMWDDSFIDNPTDTQLERNDIAEETASVLVHAFDPNESESDRYFWVHLPPGGDWDEIWDQIDLAMDGYGMEQ